MKNQIASVFNCVLILSCFATVIVRTSVEAHLGRVTSGKEIFNRRKFLPD